MIAVSAAPATRCRYRFESIQRGAHTRAEDRCRQGVAGRSRALPDDSRGRIAGVPAALPVFPGQ